MPQATKTEVISTTPLLPFEEADIVAARKRFDAYYAKEIISDCVFDNPVWNCTDERTGYHLRFDIDIKAYEQNYQPILGLPANQFILCMKTYIVCQMGVYAFDTLRQILYFIRRVIATNPNNLNSISEKAFNTDWWHIQEFFSVLPVEQESEYTALLFLDELQQQIDTAEIITGGQRTLASMDSYFKFGDILEQYMHDTTDDDARLFYSPLYLWWEITGVLPLRPCEFIVTPRNCLSCVDGHWKLTIRRNRIKGSRHSVGYKIGIDFDTETYEIPLSLAEKIQWYIDKTDTLPSNAPDLLFKAELHYKKWNRCKPYTSRYLTYFNLSTVMRYFYNEVVAELYGYKVIHDRGATSLPNDSIHYLHLGDTRHIALINIITEGGTPVVAMMLARHNNIDMTSHYFSNVNQLIECKTRRLYMKTLSGGAQYAVSAPHTPLSVQTATPLSDGGQCCNPGYSTGNYDECAKILGPHGEIGYCPKCPHYRSSKSSLTDDSARYKVQIEHDIRELMAVTNAFRAYKSDNPEDILECLLRIKANAYSYQQFLLETMEDKHGKT